MVTKKETKNIIDQSFLEYEKCWNIFHEVKEYKKGLLSAQDIISFQMILAEYLFKLEKWYNLIAQEKKRIISRKGELSRN